MLGPALVHLTLVITSVIASISSDEQSGLPLRAIAAWQDHRELCRSHSALHWCTLHGPKHPGNARVAKAWHVGRGLLQDALTYLCTAYCVGAAPGFVLGILLTW